MSENNCSINTKRLRSLFCDMLDIYSPSGKENEIVSYLKGYLKKSGLDITLQQVEKQRHNLIIMPENIRPQLLFTGHIDTVPAYDYDNYGSFEDGDEISGLGSSDMKGGCAAIIEAFLSYAEKYGTNFPAAMALVVGEEETGDGTYKLLEDYHFSWAIVAEPTDMIPCFSHYSYIESKLATSGKRMHASMALNRHNAINNMLKMLLKMTNYFDKEKEDVIYNIREMTSSQAGFVVPDTCESWIDLHLPSHYSIGTVIAELEELIQKNLPELHNLEETLVFYTIHSGYSLPEKGTIPDILKFVYNLKSLPWTTGSFPSDSDAPLLWEEGIKPIILGPGRLSEAHTENEFVDFNQIAQAADIYFGIMQKLKPN